ncbi:MAG TPA: CopG family transcriptional regulator [Patescibacteria group bacterium]|nr:CopG family transcriptional regulator [Patescibacteria group bacterium]
MKNKEPKKQPWETVTYTDNPDLPDIEDLEKVSADFLPRPEELVFRPKGVKVTITLSPASLTFFKKKARELDTSYQRMIRNLVDEYVRRMKQA